MSKITVVNVFQTLDKKQLRKIVTRKVEKIVNDTIKREVSKPVAEESA